MTKTVVITGANSGIGRTTAIDLTRKGYNVISICRNAEAGEKLVTDLKKINPAIKCENFAVDLADFVAVRTNAQAILAKYGTIDRLINNAGYFAAEIAYKADIERSFLACHLGHMLLTQILQPGLLLSPEARIINVSSGLHMSGSIKRFFHRVPGYSPMQAYADLKLANILFTMSLAKELPSNITSYSLHPGVVATNFSGGTRSLMSMMLGIFRPFLISPEKGAATTIFLADTPIENIRAFNGKYFDKKRSARTRNTDVTDANAEWLWKKSNEVLSNPLLYR